MGGNEPLRGLRWWECGASTGMKYGARWSGLFIMLRGHTGEGAQREESWEQLRDRVGECANMCICTFTPRFLAAELSAWPAHMVCYVYRSMCQVCMRVHMWARRWLENAWKKERTWQERGGVNIYSNDPDWLCVCVCFSEVVSLTSNSPEDVGAEQGWRCVASTWERA